MRPHPDSKHDEAIQRFIQLVLLQMEQDRATEFVVGIASPGGVPIRYKVEGAWYDMPPFPSRIRSDVVSELARMAGFGRDGIQERVSWMRTSGTFDCDGLSRWRAPMGSVCLSVLVKEGFTNGDLAVLARVGLELSYERTRQSPAATARSGRVAGNPGSRSRPFGN